MSVVFLCYSLRYIILLNLLSMTVRCRYLDYFIQQLHKQQRVSAHQSSAQIQLFLFASKTVQVFPVVCVQLCGYTSKFQICGYTVVAFILTGTNYLKFTYSFRNQRNGVGFGALIKILLSELSCFY